MSNFADRVKSHPLIGVKLKDGYGPHHPDNSFGFYEASPGVVFEVSYPQKRQDLRRLAYDYICGINGAVKVVIALDIESQRTIDEPDVSRRGYIVCLEGEDRE